jgi:DNA polymerase III epsilon subunit-like protein
MTDLVFIDTETTSLRPDRRAWEIGLIERVPVTVKHPDGPDTQATEDREHHWFIDVDDLELGNADPMALKIGRFYERHPQMRGQRSAHPLVKPEYIVLEEAEAMIRGAHLVGAVVSFDADVLDRRMRAHGICPSWHYHLIDVEALAVGYSAYWAARDGDGHELKGSITALPWKSEALSRALGVDPDDFERHSALGDAKWARAIYDTVMGGPS